MPSLVQANGQGRPKNHFSSSFSAVATRMAAHTARYFCAVGPGGQVTRPAITYPVRKVSAKGSDTSDGAAIA